MTDAIATPRSLLASKRAEALAKTAAIDLPVPDYDGVIVRFRALSMEETTKAVKRAEKLPEGKRAAAANTTLVANAALGIYIVDEKSGKLVPPPGFEVAPDFSSYELALSLVDGDESKLPDADRLTAADVARLLYVNDMHIISTGDTLVEKSGARKVEAEEAFRGN